MKEALKEILAPKIANSTDLEITTHAVLRLFHVLSSDLSWVGKTVTYDHKDEMVTCITESNHKFDNKEYRCPKHVGRPPLKVVREYGEYLMLEERTVIKKAWAKIIA